MTRPPASCHGALPVYAPRSQPAAAAGQAVTISNFYTSFAPNTAILQSLSARGRVPPTAFLGAIMMMMFLCMDSIIMMPMQYQNTLHRAKTEIDSPEIDRTKARFAPPKAGAGEAPAGLLHTKRPTSPPRTRLDTRYSGSLFSPVAAGPTGSHSRLDAP